MKKIFTATLLVVFSFGICKAQWVTIPDANFAAWLVQNYPSCMRNGNEIDTTCSGIVNATSVDCNNYGKIVNLTGIQYFKNLRTLNCYYNKISYVPSFPKYLITLSLSLNQLSSLPSLPSSITSFDCTDNKLTSLPTLPTDLTYLDCRKNKLTSLPQLPDKLDHLFCGDNPLINLPLLPSSLDNLYCSNSQLNYIPNFPPVLSQLILTNNPGLICLPLLSNFSGQGFQFSIENTGIRCLPNRIQHKNYIAAIDTMSICNLFNVNGCEVAWNISGTIYKDDNADCIRQAKEQKISRVKMNLYQSGNLIESGYFVGAYSFNTKLSVYKIELDTTNFPLALYCPISGDTTINVTAIDSLHYNVDYGLKCKPNSFDIGAWNIHRWFDFFPGAVTSTYISAGDVVKGIFNASCASGINGQVKIIISGPAKYNVPLPAALTPTMTGDTLLYTVPDFSLINSQTDFAFSVTTNTSAQIGDQVCFEVSVTPTAGDNNVSNNHLTHCFAVTNSYDPNEKEVSPIGSVPYPFNDWLTYTIHFQNTGNDSARHIQILDTLDANIDARSFELLSYSVMPMVQIKGSNVAFNFVNIMLPDSGHSKEGSKGYVSYRVKPQANLSSGTSLKNKASIYFDFNTPVVTNETVNTIAFPTSVAAYDWSNSISIYPNPVSEQIAVSSNQFIERIEIRNVLGQIVTEQIVKEATGIRLLSVDCSLLTAGIYFLNIKSDNTNATKKLIKY